MDDPKDYNGGLGNLEYVMANSPLASMYTHLKDANGRWTSVVRWLLVEAAWRAVKKSPALGAF